MKKYLQKFILVAAFSIFILNTNAQNTWTKKANLNALGGRYFATGFSIGDYGFVGTGNTTSGFADDFWKWNQKNNTWTSIANYAGAGRYGITSFSINGKGYACLGWFGSSNLSDLWEYDTATDTWTQKANFPGNPRYGAFVFVLGKKAYVGCGEPNGAPYYQDVYMYNSSTDTWTAVASFPGGNRTSLCAFALNGYGYVGCGWDHTTTYNDMWRYDTTNNSWTSVASFPNSVEAPMSFVIDSLAYVGAGYEVNGGKWSRDFWSYSSTTNTWSPIATLPGVSRWLGVGFTINHKGYAGLGWDSASNDLQDYWEYSANSTEGIGSILEQQGEITIYPNPSTGVFIIELNNEKAEVKNIEVYNILGEQVCSQSSTNRSSLSIDLSSDPSGIYLYRIITKNGDLISSGKMVLQK